jgi:hypothetical protein
MNYPSTRGGGSPSEKLSFPPGQVLSAASAAKKNKNSSSGLKEIYKRSKIFKKFRKIQFKGENLKNG